MRAADTGDSTSAGPPVLSIWAAVGFALIGGFLLNFMPCVLPVIGLKGNDRNISTINLSSPFGHTPLATDADASQADEPASKGVRRP